MSFIRNHRRPRGFCWVWATKPEGKVMVLILTHFTHTFNAKIAKIKSSRSTPCWHNSKWLPKGCNWSTGGHMMRGILLAQTKHCKYFWLSQQNTLWRVRIYIIYFFWCHDRANLYIMKNDTFKIVVTPNETEYIAQAIDKGDKLKKNNRQSMSLVSLRLSHTYIVKSCFI